MIAFGRIFLLDEIAEEFCHNLGELFNRLVLPVNGCGSQESIAYEATEPLVVARRQHPAVGSAIHALECHGLSHICNCGPERFERTVAIASWQPTVIEWVDCC